MADIEDILKILGQLVGFLDDSSNIQWAWFGDPKGQILGNAAGTTGLPAHRQYIGKLLRAITGGNPDDADANFATGYSWVPLNNDEVKAGFAWSTGNPLQVGFGAKADFGSGSNPIDIAVLAKLLTFKNQTVTPSITDIFCSGQLPAPDFLKSIELDAETVPPSVSATVTNQVSGAGNARTLSYTSSTNASILPWDCARIALFVLEAWIHQKAAAGGDNAFTRSDHHLFPMFGDPPSAIQPFPLFGAGNMQKAPDFSAWRDSVLNTGNLAGALAFLWHLRALLTGNENSDFLTGSFYMPLVTGGLGGSPPTALGQATGNFNPNTNTTPGAWIGITDTAGFTLVLEIQTGTAGKHLTIPLAQLNGTTLTRPAPPSLAQLNSILTTPPPGLPIKIGKTSDGFWYVAYSAQFPDASLPIFSGTYEFQAVMSSPVRFQVFSAQLPITLTIPPEATPPPPPSPAALVGMLVNWVLAAVPAGAAPSDPQSKLKNVATELGTFIAAELKTPGSGKIPALLLAIGETLADGASFSYKVAPLGFTLSFAKGTSDTYFHVKPGVTVGPITVDQVPNFPISIGNVSASLDLAVDKPSNPMFGFSLGFDDLRLGDAKGGASGLIASVIPNLKDAPGFTFQYAWSVSGGSKISGGGKIPVQLTLGPLDLSQLMVDVTNNTLSIGINLTFQLAVITVSTYELGLSFDFATGGVKPELNGLGLSFDGAGITLSGMFLNNKGDYIGGASVDIEDLFSLTAIGGYKQLGSGQASLFIFASLVAPLGGPPFCFVTGIAGGFGYNRSLPPATLMSNHPFFKIMSGQIPISSQPGQGMSDLTALDDPKTGFAPKAGDYWIAAGLQFTSFGFINGKVIVAVAFGHDFSINILGIASFGLKPVAYFEIDILVTVDAEKFLLVAGVSPNSYLVDPGIFSLSGDFGLGVWHSGPHQGDFLISIGGYHPYFKQPDYYPDLARVSVKATVFGFVHLSVECFFACTPQALMAGASVSLSATFAGIGAGLDVYVDVFIQWDPFFILASMGVTIWFEFIGRHEIGVDLTIHTPPFGGVAHISLFIVSFDVSFGASLDHGPPPIATADFFTKHLSVPATASKLLNDANVALFNTAGAAGLIRIIFTAGKTIQDQADTGKAQEGISAPVPVSPEFAFLVKTHLPFSETSSSLGQSVAANVVGDIHLPLCQLGDLQSTLVVKLLDGAKNIVPPSGDISRTYGKYPLANFGATTLVAQSDNQSARAAVSSIDTSKPAIQLLDGLRFTLNATQFPPTQTTMKGPEEQLSEPSENYPLPLAWPPAMPPVYKMPQSRLNFAVNAASTAAVAKGGAQLLPAQPVRKKSTVLTKLTAINLQVANLAAVTPLVAQAVAPKIVSTSAPIKRAVRAAGKQTTSVASPPAGVTAMAPPASPARRMELARVVLRSIPARTVTQPTTPLVLKPIALAATPAVRTLLTPAVTAAITAKPAIAATTVGTAAARPPAAATPSTPPPAATTAPAQPAPPKPSVTVVSGNAVHLAISTTRAATGTLTFAGEQTVRVIFMTAFGEPVGDQFVAGNQTVTAPARSRNILLIGEGALTGAPASLGSIGVEPDSSLYAITPRVFAGYGCVLRSNAPLLQSIEASDTLTGRDVLPASSSFSVFFPTPAPATSLLIVLAPAVPNPAPAPTQVRWRAIDATLGALNTVASASHAGFVMDLSGNKPWNLDIDLSMDWRLVSIVVCAMASADVLNRLGTSSTWDFSDDRFVEPPSPMSTTVTLEIANG